MRVELVRIGNSRGIRIPKPLIEQCGLQNTVEFRIEHNYLVSKRDSPRHGWDEAFRAAGPSKGDELLLDSGSANEFDREDWRW